MLRSQLSAVIGNCWLSALAGVALPPPGCSLVSAAAFCPQP